MHTDLCNLQINPQIAAFALYSTDFTSVEIAMAWVFEEEEGEEAGNEKMRHPFIKSLPETEVTTSLSPRLLR